MGPKQKAPKGAHTRPPSSSGAVTDDPRFSRIHTDPRLAPPRRKHNRLRVDSRFSGLLQDSRFTAKASVDRYGRKISQDTGRRELARLYRLDPDNEDEDEDSGSDSVKPRYDPARGEGVVDSATSSSEEDESEEDEAGSEVDEAEIEREAREAAAVPTGDVTSRLAALNLDWDNVRAVDLMKTFSSFVGGGGGRVVRVCVYPSEFGRERMEREEMEGPPREIFKPKSSSSSSSRKRKDGQEEGEDWEDEDEDEEEVDEKNFVKEDKGEEVDSSKLRQYQLDRLRYYYAVVECDSPATAKAVYDACDGAEYEATANFFDLRFIPNETTFDDDKPRDVADKVPDVYTPTEFVTSALQHSKVKLTWDEDDPQRKLAAKRAFSQKEIEENELRAYLASSDSESDVADDDDNDKAASAEKYRALLGGLSFGKKREKDERKGDLQVTFTPALSANPAGGKVIPDEDGDSDDGLTTIERYAKKEKARKARRKENARLRKGLPAVPEKEEAKPAEPDAEEEKAAADLGFDDPFFAEPEAVNRAAKKAARAAKAAEKAAEAAAAQGQRAELELLMASDDEDRGLRHFDMKQIVKAEKEKAKGGKKNKFGKKKRGGEEGEEMVQDDVEIDVKDPRFGALFERHEFAIDPTSSRFVKTKAMGRMLEERRKRGRRGEEAGEEVEGRERSKKRKAEKGRKEDVQGLVQSLKKKSKKA